MPHLHAGARSPAGRLALALTLLALAVPGCRTIPQGKDPATPARPITEVLAAHTPELMSVPGVVGTYQGERRGAPVIVVMVERRTPEIERRVPASLEGWPVEIEVTGEIRALPDSAP